MRILSIIFIGLLFFSACEKNDTQSKIITEPKWLLDPSSVVENKISAVGCATRHYHGQAAQKKLAIQRAIDEIAMQVSSKVQTITLRQRSVNEKSQSSKMDTTSLHSVNNLNIKTKIVDWHKKNDGDICVLVVKD